MSARAHEARIDRSRWATASISAFLSIGLHALLVQSVLLSEGSKTRPQHQDGFGANAISSELEAVATLIIIEEPDASSSAELREPMASHGVVLQNFRLTIVSPVPTLDFQDTEETPTKEANTAADDAPSDREGRAALFGRYLGQIQARIERAWLRPRTPLGNERFRCRVQVTQSDRGEVVEVALEQCNGDPRWQVSLVNAVERASPLPAPPDPKVFAHTLEFSFESAAYSPGVRDDGFEPYNLRRN